MTVVWGLREEQSSAVRQCTSWQGFHPHSAGLMEDVESPPRSWASQPSLYCSHPSAVSWWRRPAAVLAAFELSLTLA